MKSVLFIFGTLILSGSCKKVEFSEERKSIVMPLSENSEASSNQSGDDASKGNETMKGGSQEGTDSSQNKGSPDQGTQESEPDSGSELPDDPTQPNDEVEQSEPEGPPAACAGHYITNDPNANYQFPHPGQSRGVRDYLNSLGRFTYVSAERGVKVLNHDINRRKICELKGYLEVQSWTSGANRSCGDNPNVLWDEARQDFVEQNGCHPNDHLNGLTCKNKLVRIACDCNNPKILVGGVEKECRPGVP